VGPLDAVCGLIEREYDVIERQPSAALWYKAVPFLRNIGLPGSRRLLERFIAHAPAWAPEGPSALSALTTLMRGWLDIWAGRAEAAAPLLAQTDEDARWLAQGAVIGAQAAFAMAFQHALQGDADAALDAARRPQQVVLGLPEGPRRRSLEMLFGAIELRIACVVDRPAAVVEVAERLAHRTEAAGPGAIAAHLKALQGHVALARGDAELGHRLWRASLPDEEWLRMHGLDLELRVRLAADAIRRLRTAEAAALLRPVFIRAAAEQSHLPAIFAGLPALDRLAAHAWGDALTDAERQWLEHWRRLGRRPANGAGSGRGVVAPRMPPPAAALGADLSQRELEVLERLAAGDSNKIIARAFQLSPFTVKRHVANILDKLGLSSRGQAAAWLHAQER
jgi:LuxR family maltose regulon positive regulatory protein